jgi:steroid delta-isomerase
MTHEDNLQRVVQFYETLTFDSVSQVERMYSQDALFKDSFNEVRGISAITRIFLHMFSQVDTPRFVIKTKVMQDKTAFLTWDFYFRMKRFSKEEQCMRGVTHLEFSEDGLITLHRDYCDVAEELYEKIPMLGGLMRFLKNAANK